MLQNASPMVNVAETIHGAYGAHMVLGTANVPTVPIGSVNNDPEALAHVRSVKEEEQLTRNLTQENNGVQEFASAKIISASPPLLNETSERMSHAENTLRSSLQKTFKSGNNGTIAHLEISPGSLSPRQKTAEPESRHEPAELFIIGQKIIPVLQQL